MAPSHMQNGDYYNTTDDENDVVNYYNTTDDIEEETEAKTNNIVFNGSSSSRRSSFSLSRVILDPRGKWVEVWNRIFLLVCATGLFVDPLFFYTLSISDTCMCLFIDGWLLVTVTVIRCITDALHLWNIWLQFYIEKRSSFGFVHRTTRPRTSSHVFPYFKFNKGVFFDIFVILPLPQIVLWVTIPSMLKDGSITWVTIILLTIFLFQYLPKVFHSVNFLRRKLAAGYIFGTIWWGFALNMIAYFVASHVSSRACWYLLGLQRGMKCLGEKCETTTGCGLRTLCCKEPIYYGSYSMMKKLEKTRLIWAHNKDARFTCLDSADNYQYGVYELSVQLLANNSPIEKILLPIFWGLMTLSTFGNLRSSTERMETVFNIIMLISGLLLVTMLIGNMKVFLNATTSKKREMELKMKNIEWWMNKRRLPQELRQRVRNYKRQCWTATRGVDECQLIKNHPEGLRRDIRYHLRLGLVRQVPLFQHMDELVLENICDRVKSLVFTKGETLTREGDLVQRMLFVVRGHLQSSQVLRDGVKSCCMLGPGNFSGDELLSWCLRRPFIPRLPTSSSTLVTLEATEVFGLEVEDVKYVTHHFRDTFTNENVWRSVRYYSPVWRIWAAVAIQLAWRRYRHRSTLTSLSFIRLCRPLSRSRSMEEVRLHLYTVLSTLPKPNQR
ncbi:cyclic nucleotide-gated ion channel 4-like [Trifolium pratense]|uniref:cyclic nucleotide-gated ion channel 4-like n=1 Tax=Trifolium pratense TaxID=57577 RepID=UPI001E6939BE|nr:cyclic nucleotide-gated ion channel 4-like [Trifolium pratense]